MSLLGNFIGELIATFFFIAVILLTVSQVYIKIFDFYI
jgi:hypothetical protein